MGIQAKNLIPPFAAEHLEAIAKVLADTQDGLTGSQIGHLLANCQIPDTSPDFTKWKRLYNAFVEFQNKHQVGNHVVVFINKAMTPTLYTDSPMAFEQRRMKLNAVLAFCGMMVADNGKVKQVDKAQNLTQALERANRMKEQLRQRSVHSDVIKFCDAEIVAENYFHAVFEAMKSITAKIRDLSGVDADGAKLVDEAFGFGQDSAPRLALNGLATETERGEQRGFANLLKGLYGTVRNPLAHNAKVEWNMDEQDALDILTVISLIHRKLDKASVTKQSSRPS